MIMVIKQLLDFIISVMDINNSWMVQWGWLHSSTSGSGTLSYATSFKSTCRCMVGADCGAAVNVIALLATSVSTFKFWRNGSGTRSFQWLAIGC